MVFDSSMQVVALRFFGGGGLFFDRLWTLLMLN